MPQSMGLQSWTWHSNWTELMGNEVTVPQKQKPRPKGQPSTCPLGLWHFVFFVSLEKHRSNFLLLFRQANTNMVRIRKDLCPPTAQFLLDSHSHVWALTWGVTGNPWGCRVEVPPAWVPHPQPYWAQGPEALALLVTTKSLTLKGKQYQSFRWLVSVSVSWERGEEKLFSLVIS